MAYQRLVWATKAIIFSLATFSSAMVWAVDRVPWESGSRTVSELLRNQLLAGQSWRLRMLDSAAELELLDAQESELWEQFATSLAPQENATDWLQQERELRGKLLPYLAARQSRFRQTERELLGQAATLNSKQEASADASILVSLEAVRYWAELTAKIQLSVRARLDAMHVLALARGRMRAIPAESTEPLKRIGLRRQYLEAERISASRSWAASGNAIQIERVAEQLSRAQKMVDAALAAEPLVKSLQQIAAHQTVASHRRLLSLIADQVLQGVDYLAWKATDLAGGGWGRPTSFLWAMPDIDPKDKELSAELAQHRRLARDLLGSLAGRLDALSALKNLARSREELFAASAKYITPPQRPEKSAIEALHIEVEDTWRAVDLLRGLAGRVDSAAESFERAQAAAMLGAQLEKLVLLEGMLFEVEFARVADPFPAPGDQRLAAGAKAWRQDLERWIALEGKWFEWKRHWDERIGREHGNFLALRQLAGRLEALRMARMERFVASDASSSGSTHSSDVGVAALRDEARRQIANLKRSQTALAQSKENVAGDPIAGAVFTAAASEDWSQAVRSASALFGLEQRIGLLRSAPTLAAEAQDRRRSKDERLESLVGLGRAFAIPWWLEGQGQTLQARTLIAGKEFAIENLSLPEQLQLQPLEDILVQGPLRLAALSPNRELLAQITPPMSFTKEIWGPVYQELADDVIVFAAMPVVGACVGAACGLPAGGVGVVPGAMAGAAAGAAAITESVVVDVAAGLGKGHVALYSRQMGESGLISPSTAKSIEAYGVAGVSYLKAALSIAQIGKAAYKKLIPEVKALSLRGSVMPSALDYHQHRNLTRALEGIKDAQTSLASVEERLMRDVGGVAYRDWASAMDSLASAQATAERWKSALRARGALDASATFARDFLAGAAENIASALGNLNDALLGDPAKWVSAYLAALLGVSEPVTTVPTPVTTVPTPVTTAPTQVTTAPTQVTTGSTPMTPENRQSIDLEEFEKKPKPPPVPLPEHSKVPVPTQQEIRPPPPPPPPEEGVISDDPRKGMNEYDPVKAFTDRELKRSGEVGVRGIGAALGPFGNDHKFGSDSIKREMEKVHGGRTAGESAPQEGSGTWPGTSEQHCQTDASCTPGYRCQAGHCVQSVASSGSPTVATPAIPTCTTDLDCPGAKCVNNVCSQSLVTPVQPTKPTTVQPAQQNRQWYVLEAVASFTVCDLGATCTAAHKVPCTLTYWAAYGLLKSELQEALRGIGTDLTRLTQGYENSRLVSTRVYQGPSATELKTPVSGPPSKLECAGKRY